MLSKIRGLFGGELRLAVSGAAPINPDILRFFDAAGVLVLEGWGMTETSTAATISTPEDFKIGTIGKPFPGCDVRIAEDGEILVKGPNVFQGYYKNEEATRETIVDGWLHTGDLGERRRRRLHQDHRPQEGHHHHRRRQEHHPGQPRERDQAASAGLPVRGGRRPPALPGRAGHPRPRGSGRLRERERAAARTPSSSPPTPSVREAIEAHVDAVNEKFARVEQVKKIAILPRDLSQESGELTPTLKVKRAVVAEKHAPRIEKLYAG